MGHGLTEEPRFLRRGDVITEDRWELCLRGWCLNSAGGFGLCAPTNGIIIKWLMVAEGTPRPLPRASLASRALSSPPSGLPSLRPEEPSGGKDEVRGLDTRKVPTISRLLEPTTTLHFVLAVLTLARKQCIFPLKHWVGGNNNKIKIFGEEMAWGGPQF